MENKFEFLGQLPQDMGTETASHLPTPDLIRLSMTSKGHRALFTPLLEERKVLQKFLHHVVRGEHDAVKEMLKKDINLIFKKDQVTDCSGRTFHFISGFEYALWALDKHMWTMMLDCLPKNEDSKKVLAKLCSQYDHVETKGVTYKLNGTLITEKHFDFENTIIKELQTQVNSINAPGNKNWDAIDKQWIEGVGGAQMLLPMHGVDEYCSDESFYPVPKFTLQPKSSRQFYNWIIEKLENWFSVDSKLSVDFAIYKENGFTWLGGVRPLGCPGSSARGPGVDLDAMSALCKIRTNDFIDLKSLLEEQMTVDNQPQVYQM